MSRFLMANLNEKTNTGKHGNIIVLKPFNQRKYFGTITAGSGLRDTFSVLVIIPTGHRRGRKPKKIASRLRG